ncbi:hypothetical protein HDE_02851 [Halotydeus destructor]|nr:hypothetical protein HDE_02851 [Halotydeus destructor]
MIMKLSLAVFAIVVLAVQGQPSQGPLQCVFYTTVGFQFCDYDVAYTPYEGDQVAYKITSKPVTAPEPLCYQTVYLGGGDEEVSSNITIRSINTVTGETKVLFQIPSITGQGGVASATIQSADPVQVQVEQYPGLSMMYASVADFACTEQ